MPHAITDQFVKVILDVPLPSLDYRVDEAMTVAVGDRVLVPLGTRKMVGIVVGVQSNSAIAVEKLKKVISVLAETEPLREEWLKLTLFAADYYIRPWGECSVATLPVFFRKAPTARREASLKRMRLGQKTITSEINRPVLNQEQRNAVDTICASKGFAPFVLYGVTGSGKTEVYLHVMEETLRRDKDTQVLLLVPEINLTPQLESRVRERFPEESVVVMHSALGNAERAKNWLSVHEGRSRVLVGTRLSVFASFKKLGLIVVDEEHDASYKAGDGIRFSARDLAIKRAQINGIACVLGSATPSLETWAKIKSGSFQELRLHNRAQAKATLPKLALVNVSKGGREVFSELVREAVSATLERKEQVLIYINRRGYSPQMSCPACGWVSRCMHCSGFTVFHKRENALICHHCGSHYEIPQACPVCGNVDLETMGSGSQKVEEAITSLWPQARVLRIDRDSVKAKKEAEQAFRSIHQGKVDLIVGTQMISKGHDFQNVSLVVVVNADAQLVSPDLRAEERLFSTLMQVSGRAGRGGTAGRVLIQTRFDGHPLFEALRHQDFDEFADRLLQERCESFSPPFVFQALLLAQSECLEATMRFLKKAAALAQSMAGEGIRVYDPVPMALMRLMDVERGQLLVEADTRSALNAFLHAWVAELPGEAGVSWTVEVDPAEI